MDSKSTPPKTTEISNYFSGRCNAPEPFSRTFIASNGTWAWTAPRLAFVGADCADTVGITEDWRYGLFILNFDRTKPEVTRILPNQGSIGGWSPDDQWLLFAKFAKSGSPDGLWIISAQGGQPQQVSAVGVAPAWRPGTTVNTEEAKQWITENTKLVGSLESVDIPTDLFTVPGVHAYNEASARALLGRISSQLQQGKLTPQQLDAFARLTLQERALSKILPAHTSVVASLSSTSADTIETTVGVVFGLRPVWNQCQKLIPFCGRLQSDIEGLAFRSLGDFTHLFSEVVGRTPEERETAAKAMDLILRVAEDKLANGQSLKELLIDNGAQLAGTTLILQLYLGHTQGLIEKGVRTADLETSAADRWPITGKTKLAEIDMDRLQSLANIESEKAIGDYRQFQNGTNVIKIAEDVADAATLSPWAIPAKVVSIGARIEHLAIVNGPLIVLNVLSLRCIDYYSDQAAVRAFDSAHPYEDCQTRTAQTKPQHGDIVLMSYLPTTRFQQQILDEADAYQQAVQALVQATQANDMPRIEQSLEQFSQRDRQLGASLHQIQVLALVRGVQKEQDIEIVQQGQSLTIRAMMLELALAETLLARQSGATPRDDIAQIAQEALKPLEALRQSIPQLDLTPPVGQSIPIIESVQPTITNDRQLNVDMVVQNAGVAASPRLQVVLGTLGQPASTHIDLSPLAPGQDSKLSLTIPIPNTQIIAVQVLSGTMVLDTYLLSLPPSRSIAAASSPVAATSTELVPTTAQPTSAGAASAPTPPTTSTPTRTSQGGLLALGFVAIFLFTAALVVLLRQLGRRRPH